MLIQEHVVLGEITLNQRKCDKHPISQMVSAMEQTHTAWPG